MLRLVCTGCGQPIPGKETALLMERHLGVTSDDSTRVELQPQSAVLMLRLCLPCAQVNLPKIEEAIVRKVQEIQAEMRQHPSVES